MKLLVFFLVLANALFYAFSAGYFGKSENPDAERLAQQIAPERMRIVSHGEVPAKAEAPASSEAGQGSVPGNPPAPAEAKPEAKAEEKTEPVPEAKPEPKGDVKSAAPTPPPAKADLPQTCLIWRQLSTVEADKLGAVLDKRFTDYKLSRKGTPSGEANGWWVHVPPLPSKADAEKKASELRELGISELFLVQEGGGRNAISLGVFRSEKGAQDKLAELKAKGVRSAIIAPRPGKDEVVTLLTRGPAGDRSAVISAAAQALGRNDAQACK